MMSTSYLNSTVADQTKKKQNALFFPGNTADSPWTDTNTNTRFYAALPWFPFRTLSPRSTALLQAGKLSPTAAISGGGGGGMDFDYASALWPAHTQCTIVFKRRGKDNLLDFLVPYTLPAPDGTMEATLTEAKRNASLTFVSHTRDRAAGGEENVSFKITKATVTIVNMNLQVVCT